MTAARSAEQAYLFGLEQHGIKLGLENIRFLLAAAGNPQHRVPCVHVAGTNGKGSVAAFLSSMLRAAGYRTGLYTSPHLIRVNERIQVNGVPIADAALDEIIGQFRQIAAGMPHAPTFFEMCTAAAFEHFARQQTEIAVIEVGMGGRFDATNVITPLVTAITTIDYDHMEYLGNTLEAIAGEKAGIIKPGVPLVCGRIAPAPLAVIQRRARELHAPEYLLGMQFHGEACGSPWVPHLATDLLGGREIRLGLAGAHQADNAAVALKTAQLLQALFGALREEAMIAGLQSARWPGRMERVLSQPPVWMDIAHNPAGARSIAALGGRWNVLLAVSKDKDAPGMIEALAPVAERFILTQYAGARSSAVSALAGATLRAGVPYEFHARMDEALAAGTAYATDAAPLLVTGSIFTVGEARELLVSRHGAPDLQF